VKSFSFSAYLFVTFTISLDKTMPVF